MRVVSWNVNGIRAWCSARVRGLCGPVRRRYRRRPGGPGAPRGHPTGRRSQRCICREPKNGVSKNCASIDRIKRRFNGLSPVPA